MGKRVNSVGLSRAIQQIIGTLRVGGNLANNLNIIAEDISFDLNMKFKEYSQKLNSFILIYTFLAISTCCFFNNDNGSFNSYGRYCFIRSYFNIIHLLFPNDCNIYGNIH